MMDTVRKDDPSTTLNSRSTIKSQFIRYVQKFTKCGNFFMSTKLPTWILWRVV